MNVHVGQVSSRESICHLDSGQLDTIPLCSKIHKIFYRICFSIADGPLHMFSSHWSGVAGRADRAAGTTYKVALQRTLQKSDCSSNDMSESLHACCKTGAGRQVRINILFYQVVQCAMHSVQC